MQLKFPYCRPRIELYAKWRIYWTGSAASPSVKGRVKYSRHRSRYTGSSGNSAGGAHGQLFKVVSFIVSLALNFNISNVTFHQRESYWPNMNQSSKWIGKGRIPVASGSPRLDMGSIPRAKTIESYHSKVCPLCLTSWLHFLFLSL